MRRWDTRLATVFRGPRPLCLREAQKLDSPGDTWTARNPDSIRDRIEDSITMYPIGAIKGVIDVFGLLPTLVFDPAMKVGAFDWDIVPCDRLVGGC